MTTWHAPTDALIRFATEPESLDEITASSVEQHLVACEVCRSVVASSSDEAYLGRSWAEVVDRIDQPSLAWGERLLHRLGMPPHLARVVGATPHLRLAWFATTVLVAAAAVGVAHDSGSDTPFLLVAPLVPLAAVLLAFLPTEEPGGEASIATPLHGAGLLLRRVLAVLVPTFVILGVAGLAQPDLTAGGALWVLPGIALAIGALALSTVMRASTAAITLAIGWIAIVSSVSVLDGRAVPIADTLIFAWTGQITALSLALLAAAWLYTRRDAFSTLEVTW